MLEWNVYVENFNRACIEIYNIFEHYNFMRSVMENYELNKDNFENFSEMLKNDIRYYFWSKCEWEIILSDWPPSDSFKDKKVSVYDQVMLNWPVFSEYVWENIDV